MAAGRLKVATALGIVLACAVLALGATAAQALGAAPRTVRIGRAPSLPRGARTGAPLAAHRQLQLTIALQSQDPGGLESLADSVATPSSPLFRHYLGVGEFAQRFGATPEEIALVRSQLSAEGLDVGAPAANGLSLPVRASVAQVEHAFSVSLSEVALPDGRAAYANAQTPSVPAAAAAYVQGVIGLDNLALEQPQGLFARPPVSASAKVHANASGAGPAAEPLATGGPQPCPAAREVTEVLGTGETADDVASAYQFGDLYRAGDFGAGQTIAVYEQEAYSPFDIDAYQACYGTDATVTNVDVDGGPPPFEGNDLESALDIEQIIGLAPAARVLVYQGPSEQKVAPIDILSRIVSDDSAKTISTSWGLCEGFTFLAGAGVIQFENTLLQEAAAQGQSFFAASGDSGSSQCEQIEEEDTELSVNNPASQPFATGVGGTTLFSRDRSEEVRYDGALPPVEGVWNTGKRSEGLGGSGGGLSEVWTMPSYQSSAAALGTINAESSSAPCGRSVLCREVPDVSASGDPEQGYVVHIGGPPPSGGWTAVGGTSAATPLWAAFAALTDASPACNGTSIGFANPALYEIAGQDYGANFRDIVEPNPETGRANNNVAFGFGAFSVTAGYDMATGLGAPLGSTLAASLCAIATRPASSPAPPASPAAASPSAPPAAAPAPGLLPVPAIGSAELRALLLAAIVPSRKAARIASLLRASGIPLAFAAPAAGSLEIDWFQPAPVAKRARKHAPKPTLVARGVLRFTAAGRRLVTVRLTPAGRLLLKQHKRLALTARGTFTPTGKPAVTATKPLVLQR